MVAIENLSYSNEILIKRLSDLKYIFIFKLTTATMGFKKKKKTTSQYLTHTISLYHLERKI